MQNIKLGFQYAVGFYIAKTMYGVANIEAAKLVKVLDKRMK